MELNDMSLVELRKLQTKVQNEISKREASSKKTLLKRLQKMAAEEGLSLDELLDKTSPAKAVKAKPTAAKPAKKVSAKPKYFHPTDKAKTWTGHGRKPAWFAEWIAEGKSADALLVKA
ncbi:H-NS histone family protein [Thauera mechernichensis]